MSVIELAPGCTLWEIGDATKHSPADSQFLESLSKAGFLAFTGPSGLCGGKSATRTVLAIHRGRGTKWEIVFREHAADVVTTTTTDLEKTASAALSWLRGAALTAEENSLHAVAG